MKLKLHYLLGAGIIASTLILAIPLANAEDSSSSNSGSGSSSSSSESDASNQQATETETQKTEAARGDRIAKFKTEFKVSLSTIQQARIKLRCKTSQTVVGALNVRFGDKVKIRTDAYAHLDKNLTSIITKLKAANVDTTQLEAQKTTLDDKITAYKADLDKYKLALSDIKAVGCVADPSAFQAALEAGRDAHKTLTTDAADIRAYVLNTIKPTLHTIRQQLEAKQSSSQGGSQ